MKKLLALLMATAMTALAFTGCGNGEGQKADENAVNIGVLAPTTGGVAVYGQACYNSFMLAAEERNAEGGVLGKQINLMHQDEEGDITKAVNAYNKLAGDGVCAILGDITSKPTIAVAKTIAQSAKPLPMMTPTATAAPVTTFGDTVYKACFNDPYQGEVMANYAKEKMDFKSVAVLYDVEDDYSLGTAEAFKETAEKIGLNVTAFESFNGQATVDFKAQLTKINGSKPDAVFVPSYYNVIALIMTQARNDVGMTVPFIGCDGWDGVLTVLEESEKSVADGVIFSSHYFIEDEKPVVSKFVNSYREKFGEDPSSFSALSYDAAMMLFDAIEKAGSEDSEAIVKALSETDYDGVTGHIHYEEGSQDPIKSLTMLKIQDGKYQLVEDYSLDK